MKAVRQLVTAVVPQLDRLLVVDNGSRQNVGNELSDMTKVEIIELGDYFILYFVDTHNNFIFSIYFSL